MDTFRETCAGQIIYLLSGRRYLRYAEERPGFQVPRRYANHDNLTRKNHAPSGEKAARVENGFQDTADPTTTNTGPEGQRRSSDSGSNRTAVEVDDSQNENTGAIDEEDPSSVDWYSSDDPENPKNWSIVKKCFGTFCICLITTSVYMGSSIVSPAIMDIASEFGVGVVTATLTLSLFVAGYACGPLFLSPMTEIPSVGRSTPYIVTLALFCILQVPTALVKNIAGLCILRFLAGFIGSPPLATGGASLQDMWAPEVLPFSMGIYGLSAAAGPALGPVVSSYAVAAKGWRWVFWEMLWLSGFSLVFLFFWLPETSSINILVRRAQRLRRLTGREDLKSMGEREQSNMTAKDIVQMTLVRPFTMTFTEPIVLACNFYIGFIYALLYAWFESFPIVYTDMYGWSAPNGTLPFLAILVGSVLGYIGYCFWNYYYYIPLYRKNNGNVAAEYKLLPACVGCFCFPITLFWFGWTGGKTFWLSPVIASSFFGVGTTLMFLSILTYLPQIYPKYAASVLASNDFTRSMLGAGMPLAAHGLFVNLGIAWANTLLGCISVLFLPLPFVLYKYGPWLRAKSSMADHANLEKVDEK